MVPPGLAVTRRVVDTPIVIDLSPYKELVRDGSNSIAIHGLNSSASIVKFFGNWITNPVSHAGNSLVRHQGCQYTSPIG